VTLLAGAEATDQTSFPVSVSGVNKVKGMIVLVDEGQWEREREKKGRLSEA